MTVGPIEVDVRVWAPLYYPSLIVLYLMAPFVKDPGALANRATAIVSRWIYIKTGRQNWRRITKEEVSRYGSTDPRREEPKATRSPRSKESPQRRRGDPDYGAEVRSIKARRERRDRAEAYHRRKRAEKFWRGWL